MVANTALGTGSGANSTLADILFNIGGREFLLPAGSEVYASNNVKLATHGSFTRPNVQNGTVMVRR